MMSGPPDDQHCGSHRAELRSFGRRRGRKLSGRQGELLRDRLPALQIDLSTPLAEPLSALFSVPVGEVWLEIGFGGGEHLIWQVRHYSSVGIIGCEPFEEGVVKALSAIDEYNLPNVRLHADDARPLLRWLPEGSLDRVFILFPDPWPKRKHIKRRLINSALLGELARVMKPGAELRVGTDIGDYARTILHAVLCHPHFMWTARRPQDWRERSPDWPQTRYEQKALREGRRGYFLRFQRR